MRIHFIQHMPFEHPASIADWAQENEHSSTYTRIFADQSLPAIDSFDMLVIMGGVMGVYEEEKYDWLKEEKLFIKNSIANNKKVFGVCLGAQLIAEALGAKVYPHTKKEIGWFEIEKVQPHKFTEHLPQTLTTFHWHGDTFNLPENAIHIFKSQACSQQGFVYNDQVIGLQFHMEVRKDLLDGMTDNERAELKKDLFVQTEDEIKTLAVKHLNQQKNFMFKLLDAFAIS